MGVEASRRTFAGGLVGLSVMAAADTARSAESGTSANPPYGCNITNYTKAGNTVLETYDCSNRTDIQFITYALALEYLQAEFYLNAAQGYGLAASDQGDRAGLVSGAHRIPSPSPYTTGLASEFGTEQTSHVRFLRQLIISLGRVPLSRPAIDFSGGFTSIAQQAGLRLTGPIFDAFRDDINFFLGAYILQDVIVTGYHYLLQQVRSPIVLDKLSGLMASEGYIAGTIRATLFSGRYSNVTNQLSYLRDRRDGSAGTPQQGNDHGVGTFDAPTIVVGDGNAIIANRNTQMVAAILPAGNNGTPGDPFFPQGIMSPP